MNNVGLFRQLLNNNGFWFFSSMTLVCCTFNFVERREDQRRLLLVRNYFNKLENRLDAMISKHIELAKSDTPDK